jgi:hypothetical protein
MSNRKSTVLSNLVAVAAAAFIGGVFLTTGPASAESTWGDQSFDRGTPAMIDRSASATHRTARPAEGVAFQTVAEYSPDISGVQKVALKKVTLAPGATLANFTVTDPLYCSATAGTISVVDHAKGTTAVYRSGDHWQFASGQFTLSNPGEVDHVHYLYAMVRDESATASQVTPGTNNLQPSGFRGSSYIGKL